MVKSLPENILRKEVITMANNLTLPEEINNLLIKRDETLIAISGMFMSPESEFRLMVDKLKAINRQLEFYGIRV